VPRPCRTPGTALNGFVPDPEGPDYLLCDKDQVQRVEKLLHAKKTQGVADLNTPADLGSEILDVRCVIAVDPNAEIFAENDTYEWIIRLNGSYQFPYGILLSARYEGRSGDPWARTALLEGGEQIPDIEVRVEPIGSQRLPHVDLVSLRGEKGFNIGGSGNELMVRVNLHNLLNDTAATSTTSLSGSSYGTITGYVLPQIVNFEVQYRF